MITGGRRVRSFKLATFMIEQGLSSERQLFILEHVAADVLICPARAKLDVSLTTAKIAELRSARQMRPSAPSARFTWPAAALSGKITRAIMNREYHKGYSSELHRDMELLVFGHAGTPLLVFPTSQGRFFEYEDRNMIGVLAPKIDAGELQVFCLDAVDSESWYNRGVHPRVRVLRHLQYERYILHEMLPFLRWKNNAPRLAITGCSFGGYHAMNFSLKHPDVVTYCVSMSGAFDIHQFLDGYYDDDCYFNCPPDFVPNISDDWFLSRYRKMNLVLGSADWDICLDQNVKFSGDLECEGNSALAGCVGRQLQTRLAVVAENGGKIFCLKLVRRPIKLSS